VAFRGDITGAECVGVPLTALPAVAGFFDIHRRLQCRPAKRTSFSQPDSPGKVFAPALRHVLAHVSGQDLVDQRLVADASPSRFLAELIEHGRIDADSD
jgi:hypothetical protein